MNNEELKKKIIEIMSNVWSLPVPCTAERKFERIADALIAAGIGDVKVSENKATAAEIVAQAAASTAIERVEEWKHRAARAERAGKIAASKVFDYTYEEAVAQAEKELAEEGKDENY